MTTLKQVLEAFIDETRIGLYGTATARAATTITDAPNLANTNWSAPRFKSYWIQVPADTAGNNIRPATTLSTAGVLTQGGANWLTSGDTPYYRLTAKDWHPTRDLVPLANRALKLAWEWWRSPLTMVTDGDMQTALATNWTGSSATPTKITTRTWGNGIQSLRVANSGANGYAASAAFETQPGRGYRFSAKCYSVTGTPFMAIVDAGGTVLQTVTATPATTGTWMEIQDVTTMPFTANGGTATIRLGGVQSSADIDWADVQVVPNMQTRISLPTWLTEWRDTNGIETVRIYQERNRLGTIGSWPARAYDLDLIDPSDYQITQAPSSLNPLEIEFSRNTFLTGFPIYVEARRPFFSFGAVSADADVSGIPLLLWLAAMKYLAAKERKLVDRIPEWQADYNDQQRKVASLLTIPTLDSRGMAYTVMP